MKRHYLDLKKPSPKRYFSNIPRASYRSPKLRGLGEPHLKESISYSSTSEQGFQGRIDIRNCDCLGEGLTIKQDVGLKTYPDALNEKLKIC